MHGAETTKLPTRTPLPPSLSLPCLSTRGVRPQQACVSHSPLCTFRIKLRTFASPPDPHNLSDDIVARSGPTCTLTWLPRTIPKKGKKALTVHGRRETLTTLICGPSSHNHSGPAPLPTSISFEE
ncbi:hypothetical protein VDGE_30720 [Verticillium dahliae]|uniref:Uncharacterized protein n=1 Tax=Verticillium dahliae TaxID=27337 RepID=A0A444SAZ1_VERDA|nr:hypothetical protein VDGE_30720 [Verticillium dahliae]